VATVQGEEDGTGSGDSGGGSNQIRRSNFGGDWFQSIGGAGRERHRVQPPWTFPGETRLDEGFSRHGLSRERRGWTRDQR
jgi:hypothetical protein